MMNNFQGDKAVYRTDASRPADNSNTVRSAYNTNANRFANNANSSRPANNANMGRPANGANTGRPVYPTKTSHPDNSVNPSQPVDQPDIPEDVPENFVDEADEVIRKIGKPRPYDEKYDFLLTTSKLRNILSMASDIYNEENARTDEKLLPKSVTALQKMRVRIVYEAGRDEKTVSDFVKKSKILLYIKGIGTSREKFIRFENYLEALVAYHRFYGGKEN